MRPHSFGAVTLFLNNLSAGLVSAAIWLTETEPKQDRIAQGRLQAAEALKMKISNPMKVELPSQYAEHDAQNERYKGFDDVPLGPMAV